MRAGRDVVLTDRGQPIAIIKPIRTDTADQAALVKRYVDEIGRHETYPLRTLDAIHVSAAQLFATRMMTPALMFVSAAARQTKAAAALGMTVRQIDS